MIKPVITALITAPQLGRERPCYRIRPRRPTRRRILAVDPPGADFSCGPCPATIGAKEAAMTTEQRLERLERENRWMRRITLETTRA